MSMTTGERRFSTAEIEAICGNEPFQDGPAITYEPHNILRQACRHLDKQVCEYREWKNHMVGEANEARRKYRAIEEVLDIRTRERDELRAERDEARNLAEIFRDNLVCRAPKWAAKLKTKALPWEERQDGEKP